MSWGGGGGEIHFIEYISILASEFKGGQRDGCWFQKAFLLILKEKKVSNSSVSFPAALSA